ncbi:hypothetical protein [Massiliimalia timonensis]|uniref:Uncharacterized protein n=1 Tax=Massiliimalia timonensis TaxID=1987501 RepID=A0A8J6P6D7_9FIRM|nr:hypothetical protein [Massiliimalia timonensis]MBC8611853.1 hypothetical protein [Massiliimalia timonensis]MBS7175138.1 hypothetical protein [Clostridiales bacterium]
MNLVLCDKDCLHQKDGYCKLKANAAPTGTPVGGCCYYCPKPAPKQKSRPR